MAIPLKRLAFTDAWLKAVQLSEDRPEYADTKTQGLYLRVGTRSKVFIATYRIKGGPLLRKKLGDYPKLLSLKKARERADEVRRQAKSGIDVRVVEREEREAKERAKELRLSTSVFDLSAMILWYIEQRSGATAKQLAKKTIANYRALHRFYINGLAGKPFRGQPVGEVAPSEIRKMLAEIAKKSATQANRLFELIRASYRLASYDVSCRPFRRSSVQPTMWSESASSPKQRSENSGRRPLLPPSDRGKPKQRGRERAPTQMRRKRFRFRPHRGESFECSSFWGREKRKRS